MRKVFIGKEMRFQQCIFILGLLAFLLGMEAEAVGFAWPTMYPTMPTATPTTAPTMYPTMPPSKSPTTSKPTLSPTTSRPTTSPSRTPSRSPSRSPTLLAVNFPSRVEKNEVIFNEQTQVLIPVTNRLSSDVQISFAPCVGSSSAWIFPRNITDYLLATGGAIDFVVDLHVTSVGEGTDPMLSSSVITGCVRLKATTVTDWEPQYHDIQIDSHVSARCQPGSSSSTGTNHPSACTLCALGTYSTDISSTTCQECPENMPKTDDQGSDSPGLCLACPLGFYCPVATVPQKCPMGAYEPLNATEHDRKQQDCVRFACEEKYFCGSGAAEGETYTQWIEYERLSAVKILVKQKKIVEFDIENMGDEQIVVQVSTVAPKPFWLDYGSPSTIEASSHGLLTLQLDSVDIVGERLDSHFTIDWYLASAPNEKFQATVDIDIQIIMLIVTPEQFDYEFSIGRLEVTPVPVVEVFNTLCNNAVTYTVSPMCNGKPLPSWISFPVDTNSDPFESRYIEEQRGLPDRYDFGFEFNDSIFNVASLTPAAAAEPAPTLKTCFNITLVLHGLDLILEEEIPINIRVYRPCPKGTSSPKGDNSHGCTPCAAGYYQDLEGQTFCYQCPESYPRTLRSGSNSISDCIPDIGGFISNNGTLEKCPYGAICDEVGLTVETLKLQPGFWRASALSAHVLECPRPRYCVGGRLANRSSIAASHGRFLQENLTDLPSPDGVCRQNHTGIFCHTCLPGYFKRTGESICMLCTDDLYMVDRSRVIGIFVGTSLAFFLFLSIFFYASCRQHKIKVGQSQHKKWEERIQRIYDALDISIPLQIVIGFVQVVGSMSVTFQEILPPFFAQIRDAFSILALDVIQVVDFGCTLYYKNHFASLLVTTLIPIAVTGVLVIIYFVLARTIAKYDALLRQELRTTTFSAFLVLLFLVYPSCSVRILATFSCRSFDDGRISLVTDPGLSCATDLYKSYYAYAVVMTFVYPVGVPVFYSVLLYRERHALNPYTPGMKLDKVVSAVRDKDHNVKYLRFLWRAYKTRYFWFETFELIRKLAQTSVVVFVATGSSGQIIFQMLVTVISIVVLNSMLPYADILNNLLALIAQWAIFGIAVISLLIKLNTYGINSGITEYNQSTLDSFLILMFFVVPCCAFLQVCYVLFGRGAMREVLFFLNWNRIDNKVAKLRAKSFKKIPGKKIQDSTQNADDLASLNIETMNVQPSTFQDALTLSRRLRDNLNLLRRDLTEQVEQQRTKAEILEDERNQLEFRNQELEAELEKAKILIAEQETLTAKQAMEIQDAVDRAEAARRKPMIIGRSSSLGVKRNSSLNSQSRKVTDIEAHVETLDRKPSHEPRASNLSKTSHHGMNTMSKAIGVLTAPFRRTSMVTSEPQTDGQSPQPSLRLSFFGTRGGSPGRRSPNSRSPNPKSPKSPLGDTLTAISEKGESNRSIVFIREKELRDGSVDVREHVVGEENVRHSMRSVVKEKEYQDGTFQVDIDEDD